MSNANQPGYRPHSSHNDAIYSDVPIMRGVPIRCQRCSGQTFRRSTLRSSDLTELFFMRYPVRCTRCSMRQMVSFTVAAISIPSSVKTHRPAITATHWSDLSSESSTQHSAPTRHDSQ